MNRRELAENAPQNEAQVARPELDAPPTNPPPPPLLAGRMPRPRIARCPRHPWLGGQLALRARRLPAGADLSPGARFERARP